MKRLILFAFLAVATLAQAQIENQMQRAVTKPSSKAIAYNPKNYLQDMQTNLKRLKEAKKATTFKSLATSFKTIADTEKNKWIPYYHAAYSGIIAAYLTKEKFAIEDLLNEAQQCLDKAFVMRPRHSELLALQGFLYQARIRVNPQQRSQEYTKKAIQALDRARFADPKNPRASFLTGQFLEAMPKEWGGGKTKNSCKHFREAKEKFDAYKPKSDFSPNWGKETNEKMLKACK